MPLSLCLNCTVGVGPRPTLTEDAAESLRESTPAGCNGWVEGSLVLVSMAMGSFCLDGVAEMADSASSTDLAAKRK